MIAKRAGSASCGAIVPFPISVPINVPTICAITAPGPSKADKPGIEQITPRATSPKTFPANFITEDIYVSAVTSKQISLAEEGEAVQAAEVSEKKEEKAVKFNADQKVKIQMP